MAITRFGLEGYGVRPIAEPLTGPFQQFDWSKPFSIRLSKPQADVYRQHLLTNPIPFAQYNWPLIQAVRRGTPHQFVYNPNLYPSVAGAPFNQLNWPKVQSVRRSASDATDPSENWLFSAATTAGFHQTDWPKVQPIRRSASDATDSSEMWLFNAITATVDPRAPVFSRVVVRIANPSDEAWPNIVLTAPVAAPPFAQKDWPKVTPVRIGAVDSYNVVLFDGSIPFNQFDWSKTVFSSPRAPNQQLYNLALLTQVAVTAPFYQTDWSKTAFQKSRAPNQSAYNLALIGSPFHQTDWPKVQGVKTAAPQQYGYNPNLFVAAIQAPFFKTDWSNTFWPIPSKPQSTPLNLCLYTNPIPFAQYDWGKWRAVKISKQFDQQPGYLNFYTNQQPFAQYDWSKPVRVPVDRGQNTSVNLNLFKNPIPVFNRPSTVTNPIRFTSVPQTVNFQLLFAIPVVVTVSFDPFVKKRSKPKRQRDRLRDELEIKYKRRLAIEEAFWPPTTYELPEYKLPMNVKPAPDVSDLANVIMQVHAMRAKQSYIDDEEDLMKLLREEYGITDV